MKNLIKIITTCLERENYIKSYKIFGSRAQVKLTNDKIINISLSENGTNYIASKNRRN